MLQNRDANLYNHNNERLVSTGSAFNKMAIKSKKQLVKGLSYQNKKQPNNEAVKIIPSQLAQNRNVAVKGMGQEAMIQQYPKIQQYFAS